MNNSVDELLLVKEEYIHDVSELFNCNVAKALYCTKNRDFIESIDNLIDIKKNNINELYYIKYEIHNVYGGQCASKIFINLKDCFSFISTTMTDICNENSKDENVINKYIVMCQKKEIDNNEIYNYFFKNCYNDLTIYEGKCDYKTDEYYYVVPKLLNYLFIKHLKICKNHKAHGKRINVSEKEKICHQYLLSVYPDILTSYKIGNYYVDFFDKESNTIIEFLGDYYHGNLDVYSRKKK